MIRFLFALMFCLLFNSCTKDKKETPLSTHPWRKRADTLPIDKVRQQEAMLIDVPIPLYDERLAIHNSDQITQNTTMLGYRSPLSIDDIIMFYTEQMERLGWNTIKIFNGIESLMQFESPDRLCTISVRPHHKRAAGTDVIIFIGAKEDVLTS